MNSPATLLNLEKRRALLWVRKRQPIGMPPPNDRAAPPRRILIDLVRDGLICFAPDRKRFDPPTYVLTDAGERALQP
jgi:hypothetical protein